jgi:hypothetical protein
MTIKIGISGWNFTKIFIRSSLNFINYQELCFDNAGIHHPYCTVRPGINFNWPTFNWPTSTCGLANYRYATYDAHRTRILRVTFAWHMRQIHAGCALHPRIRSKCCAHLPRATRDVTFRPLCILHYSHSSLSWINNYIPFLDNPSHKATTTYNYAILPLFDPLLVKK